MNNKNRVVTGLFSACLLIVCASCVTPRSAPSAPREDIVEKALPNAKMVFHGVVSDVKYRLSEEGIPHAFVTYEIKKMLRGQLERKDSNSITLRFIGGPKGNGSFLTVSGVPNFSVGDEDVLLVRDNGKTQCPLVHCGSGRFRVLDNRVFNFEGIPVFETGKGRIVAAGLPKPKLQVMRFPAPGFEEVYGRKDVQEQMQKSGRKIDMDELRKRFEQETPREIVVEITTHEDEEQTPDSSSTGRPGSNKKARSRSREKTTPMSVEAFVKVLNMKAGKLLDRPEPTRSLDPNKAFNFKLPEPSAPPAKVETGVEPKAEGSEQDREEIRLLREQNFDPVLKSAP